MKIVSLVNKNSSVNFSNNIVKFDENGLAEVKKELGETIIKNFPKTVWEEGNAPQTKKEKNVDVDVNKEEYKGLKEEIERLKGIIVSKTDEVEKAKKSEQTWRDEFQKLQDQMNGKVPVEEATEDTKKVVVSKDIEVPEKHKELYEGMKGKNYAKLKTWTKDNLNKTDEDLSEIEALDSPLRRDALIKFVLENYPE